MINVALPQLIYDMPKQKDHNSDYISGQSKLYDKIVKEWQSEDDPAMDHRMLYYRAMLRQKYGLSVKQYVIFLARPKSTMPYIIDEENLKFRYNLIPLQQYSHKIFLDSALPEQKLMAIFGNFDNEAPVEVIKQILQGIEEQGDGELSVKRYRQQLRALIQLRKLGKEFKIAMGTITKFKVEKDPFFQDGVKKGKAEGRHEEALEIAREMKKDKFPIEQIAKLTKLSRKEIEAL
jgi:predicted transposase YdaD